jgi:hypothetical protein
MAVSNQTHRGQVELSTAGVSYNLSFSGVTIPGTNQDLISVLVPSGKTLVVLQCYIVCVRSGKIEILKDSSEIGGGQIGPGESNFHYSWLPNRSISAGETFKMTYEGYSNKPAAPIKAYLQARLLG